MDWYAILALTLVVALIISISYTIYIKLFEKKYTRERFAFASLTASTSLVIYAMAQVTSHEALLERIFVAASHFLGITVTAPEPITSSGRMLTVVLVGFGLFIIHLLNRSINQWHGQISVDDYARSQEHRPRPWFQDGIDEGARVLTRAPNRPTRAFTKQLALRAILETPTINLVWHEHARELVGLWASTIRFSSPRDGGWNSIAKCWKGRDTTHGQSVLLFCYSSPIGERELSEIERFLEPFPSKAGLRILVATRSGDTKYATVVSGLELEIISEAYLLDHLVDFTDYVFEIRRRVEEARLPDSDLHIPDIYVESELWDARNAPSIGFEQLLFNWLNDAPGTHLAVLGEYGQGKSTGALMFVYHYMQRDYLSKTGRIPILLELRGKSPSNLSPAELLGAWAQQYQIHASALMKLLVAGRLIIIFEGFDEMANISDVEQRIDQFRALWRFAYPETKLVFTGRPNLFFQRKEIDVVFRGNISDGQSPCRVFHLKPFSTTQIAESLRWLPSSTRDEILRVAETNSQLFDIVSRPSLLYIVGLLWPQLKGLLGAGTITSADVIGLFVEHSFKRQRDKEALGAPSFMVLTEGERRYFHEGIAYEMAIMRAPNQITDSEFLGCIRRLYETYPKDSHLIEPGVEEKRLEPLGVRVREFDHEAVIDMIATDVRTHGVLVNDVARPSTYKFAHKSFFEYLAAKVAAYQLLNLDRQFYGAIRAASEKPADLGQSLEMLAFFGETVVNRFKRSAENTAISIEAMVFDRMTRLDSLPRFIKIPTRRFLIVAFLVTSVLNDVVTTSVEYNGLLLARVFRFRRAKKKPTREAEPGQDASPDETKEDTEARTYLNNRNIVRFASVTSGVATGVTFGALGISAVSSAPGLPLKVEIMVVLCALMLMSTAAIYTRGALSRWASCLLFGGRTKGDLAAFIGKRSLRQIVGRDDQEQ